MHKAGCPERRMQMGVRFLTPVDVDQRGRVRRAGTTCVIGRIAHHTPCMISPPAATPLTHRTVPKAEVATAITMSTRHLPFQCRHRLLFCSFRKRRIPDSSNPCSRPSPSPNLQLLLWYLAKTLFDLFAQAFGPGKRRRTIERTTRGGGTRKHICNCNFPHASSHGQSWIGAAAVRAKPDGNDDVVRRSAVHSVSVGSITISIHPSPRRPPRKHLAQ